MEKEEGIKSEHRSDFRGHLSSNFPDASQPSHTMLNTHRKVKGNVLSNFSCPISRKLLTRPSFLDIKQNPERCNHDPYIPPTWLTGSQPSISGLPQNNIAKDYKNLQNNQTLNNPLPPYYSLPGDLVHQSHSPVQQKPPSMDHLWAGIRQEFMPTAHFTPPAASQPRLPVLNPMTWGMMDVPDPSEERIQCSEPDKEKVTKAKPKHRRKGKESDRSSELDCRPG